MKTMLVLSDPEQTDAMIRWTGRLVEACFSPLTVLCVFKGAAVGTMEPVSSEHMISGHGLLRLAHATLEEMGLGHCPLLELHHPDPVTAIIETLENQPFDLLISGTAGRLEETGDVEAVGERLFRFGPCETLLIDPGRSVALEKSRILVPLGSSQIKPTLKFSLELVRRGGTVVPFLVGPEFGADSRAVARKELELKLREADIPKSDKFVPEVIVAEKTMSGLARAVRDGDTLLVTASSAQVLHKFRSAQIREKQDSPSDCSVAVYSPPKKSRGAAVREWMLPKLTATQRVRLFDQLQSGARFNPDFLIMMGMATAIAALGLLANSGAVVIGAMLVAPLMSPLIGAGFALIQGNVRLFNNSMKAVLLGIAFGLCLSVIIGWLNPNEDLTTEIMARTAPEARDLFVAFLSGAAAAYALSKPGLAGTLAGVAIAAALVPPLATVGIGLSRGMWEVVMGAAILHITNLVAITLGAAGTFRMLGIQGLRLGIGPALWARRAGLGLILVAVLLSAPLIYKSVTKAAEGPNRPMAYPLSRILFLALKQRIEKEPGLELMLAGRSSFTEEGAKFGIMLAAEGPVSPDLRRDLRQLVKETIGVDTEIHIYSLQKTATPTQ